MAEASTAATPQLTQLGNVVPEGYKYYEKTITPREGLAVPHAYLKWYDLYPDNGEITNEQREAARAFVAAEATRGRQGLKDELGFVIFHRAGKWLLLMVMTWRDTNEIWESVYLSEVESKNYRETKFDTNHRGTYCVWELPIVWHERNAWLKFIKSKRDDDAKLAYINDRVTARV